MQKFFESTLVSSYIKYLLANCPLPLYPTIQTGENLIAGLTYIYKHNVLLCTSSGKFNGINADSFKQDYLYASDDLYATDEDEVMKHWVAKIDESGKVNYSWEFKKDEGPAGMPSEDADKHLGGLTVTDDIVQVYYQPIAKFEIIGRYTFGESISNFTKNFISNVNYYDSKTHRALGEYLRCLRDIQGIDLMSLYNCFDYTVRRDLILTQKGVEEGNNRNNKVILVPIKFNKTYTISIECPFPVIACPILFNGKPLLYDKEKKSLSNLLLSSLVSFNSLQFTEPQKIRIVNDPSAVSEQTNSVDIEKITQDCVYLYKMERYLYLAIQIPAANSSSVVVLEGDYSNACNSSVASIGSLRSLSEPAFFNIFRSTLSLLHMNDTVQHPFSDKLISYLLRYTIDNREYIDENVKEVVHKSSYSPDLPYFYDGTWDRGLQYALYNTYINKSNISWLNKYDILGYVDADIENALDKGILTIPSDVSR